MHPLLPDDEILRRLRAIKHSPYSDRILGKTTTVRGICKAAGIGVGRFYELVQGTVGLGPVSRARLSVALMHPRFREKGSVVASPAEPEISPISLDFGRYFPKPSKRDNKRDMG